MASVKGPGDNWEAGGVPDQSSFYGVCGHGTIAGVKSERKSEIWRQRFL